MKRLQTYIQDKTIPKVREITREHGEGFWVEKSENISNFIKKSLFREIPKILYISFALAITTPCSSTYWIVSATTLLSYL